MQKQAQKPKQKRPTRRSMTFSGCFTCRARGVKCDEQRPACQRCVKAKRECAGYGVRLKWQDRKEGQTSPKGQKSPRTVVRGERRSLPWAYGHEHADRSPGEAAALGDQDLDAVIAALPEEQNLCHADPCTAPVASSHPHARLFAVFAATSPAASASASDASDNSDCTPSPSVVETSPDNMLVVHDLDGTVDPDAMDFLDDTNDDFNTIYSLFVAPWLTPTPSAAQHIVVHDRADAGRLFPSLQPSKESRLLDYWVNHTSSIMVSIPRRENPFRTIFVPMALAAQSQLVPSAEYKALLHGIYAMVAFNYAQRQPVADRSAYNNLGISQHQLSVAHLQQSLSFGLGHVHNPEVVLATIILLTTTNCITSNSTAWRTCIRLGRQWILSSANETWRTRQTTSTLYQIFLVIEAVGTSANTPPLPGPLPDPLADTAVTAVTASYGYDYSYSNIFGLSCTAIYHNYELDNLYGITQPMFEAMVHMNQLAARADQPSQQELDNLRIKILLNDPRARRTDALAGVDDTERRFLLHHAYIFYFACRIHYERMLLRAAPHTIQHLVRGALGHLEAIAHLQTNSTVLGLTWPVLVIACEADDPGVQRQVSWYFDKGQTCGVWSISSARRILSEVWRRRQCQPRDDHASVSWQKVMKDLGLDLLLT